MELTLNSSNFDGEVMKSDKPVLVDFWAAWCGPCQMVGPVISEVAQEYAAKAKVGKVNVDENGPLCATYGIVSIPTVIIFVDGKPVERLVGAHSFDDYADALDKYVQ